MDSLDLNLLVTLDVLLSEGSVVGAAKRLQLSASAMSRSLARLREATEITSELHRAYALLRQRRSLR